MEYGDLMNHEAGGLKYFLTASQQMAVLSWERRMSVQTINNKNAKCGNMSKQIPPLPFWWKAKDSFFMKNKIINIFYFYYLDKAENKNTMILAYLLYYSLCSRTLG